jgi:prepilin-type N-terminal cleavage/methylation domain-containing protein
MSPDPIRLPPTRHGMTLIEVMIALAILVSAITVVFSGLLTERNVQTQMSNQALAYSEIQAQIETYQYLPFVGLQQNFKGAQFDVQGLKAINGKTSVGTVSKVSNPNWYDPTVSPTNPNSFSSSDTVLPLRFRCEWDDSGSPMSCEVIYILAYRGI